MNTDTYSQVGPPTGGKLGNFALGPTMLGAPRTRQGAFSDFDIKELTIIKDYMISN